MHGKVENTYASILCIEDEKVIRKTFSDFLQELGHHVFEAEDGEKGISMFREIKPDVILLDLNMPKMGGLDVLRIIGDESPETPIIIISGQGDIDMVIEALRRGAFDYLTKPLNSLILLKNSVERAYEKITLFRENIAAKVFLEKANIELEKHVEERTEALVLANKKLQVELIERDSAEKALRESEEKFKLIFENANDEIIYVDKTGRILDVNQKAKDISGYTPEEVIGKNFSEIDAIKPEDMDNLITHFAEVCESKKTKTIEIELIKKDTKEEKFIEINPKIIERNGEIEGFVSILRDITERKEMELALRESEERFKNIFEQATDSIIIIDPDSLDILQFNRSTYINLGYTGEEFQEIVFHDLGDEGFQSALKKHFDTVNRLGKDVFETALLTKSKETRNAQISTKIIAVGEKKLLLSVWRDITEETKAKIALKNERAMLEVRVEERTEAVKCANKELARAIKHKDEFLANMSHELRTPLTTILGITEVLLEEVYGRLNSKQTSHLQNIDESGRHLLSMINDILDLSKIEAGKMDMNMEQIDIEDTCNSVVRMTEPLAKKKKIGINVKIHRAVEFVEADTRSFKQMLINLLNNAIKFTPVNKLVGIDIVGDIEEEKLKVVVWDQGPGISAEDAKHLFKPFVQIDGGLAKKYGGTGLGLYLVYRLVMFHNGNISVESIPEEGSKFIIELPWDARFAREVSPEQLDQEDEKEASDVSKKYLAKILLVDDNQINVEVVNDYLIVHNYETIVAYNGEDAITYAIENQPDLILMDIQLPGMSGFEAIKEIRKKETSNNNDRRVPIIALTALAMQGDKEKCLDAGADGYLSKPFSLKKLIEQIKEHLQIDI